MMPYVRLVRARPRAEPIHGVAVEGKLHKSGIGKDSIVSPVTENVSNAIQLVAKFRCQEIE